MALYARYSSVLYENIFEVSIFSDQCFSLQEVVYCAKKAGVTHILKAGGAQV